jgi:hypothetical protein
MSGAQLWTRRSLTALITLAVLALSGGMLLAASRFREGTIALDGERTVAPGRRAVVQGPVCDSIRSDS